MNYGGQEPLLPLLLPLNFDILFLRHLPILLCLSLTPRSPFILQSLLTPSLLIPVILQIPSWNPFQIIKTLHFFVLMTLSITTVALTITAVVMMNLKARRRKWWRRTECIRSSKPESINPARLVSSGKVDSNISSSVWALPSRC